MNDLNLEPVEFELDSKVVVDKVHSSKGDDTEPQRNSYHIVHIVEDSFFSY
jgi:hypothetical protein